MWLWAKLPLALFSWSVWRAKLRSTVNSFLARDLKCHWKGNCRCERSMWSEHRILSQIPLFFNCLAPAAPRGAEWISGLCTWLLSTLPLNWEKCTLVPIDPSWNNRKINTALCPWFLTQGSWKSSNFLGGRNVFCSIEVALSGLLDGSWMGAGHRATKLWLEAWTVQPWPPVSWEERANNRVKDQSCLCEEGSIKIPTVWGLGSFQEAEHIHGPGAWPNPTLQGQRLLHLGPSQAPWIFPSGCSCVLLHVLW